MVGVVGDVPAGGVSGVWGPVTVDPGWTDVAGGSVSGGSVSVLPETDTSLGVLCLGAVFDEPPGFDDPCVLGGPGTVTVGEVGRGSGVDIDPLVADVVVVAGAGLGTTVCASGER
jgi:hypothetical protein